MIDTEHNPNVTSSYASALHLHYLQDLTLKILQAFVDCLVSNVVGVLIYSM